MWTVRLCDRAWGRKISASLTDAERFLVEGQACSEWDAFPRSTCAGVADTPLKVSDSWFPPLVKRLEELTHRLRSATLQCVGKRKEES